MELDGIDEASTSALRESPHNARAVPKICITPASPQNFSAFSSFEEAPGTFIKDESPSVDASLHAIIPEASQAIQAHDISETMPDAFVLDSRAAKGLNFPITDLSLEEQSMLARVSNPGKGESAVPVSSGDEPKSIQSSQGDQCEVDDAPMNDASQGDDVDLSTAVDPGEASEKEGKRPADSSTSNAEEPALKKVKVEETKPEFIKHEDEGAAGLATDFQFLKPNGDRQERLVIKQKALEVGMKSIQKIKGFLQCEIAESRNGDEVIEEMIKKTDEIMEKARGHEVLVGVSGGTGVGKASLLNACLGYDELLPSGQEEASTAVPSKVSFNYDDSEDHGFRAEVYFHSKDSITEELRIWFQAFFDSAEAAEEGDSAAMEEQEALIKKGMDRFSPVWKFEEGDIDRRLFGEAEEVPSDDSQSTREEAALAWIMGLNPDVTELLSVGRKELHSSAPQLLAKQVKPYLDSSEGAHSDSDDPALKFAAWPLVREVRIYVKSDLLKDGVCLVDLPGVGDINCSRNSVAGQYMQQLHLTTVIASIDRGKDTKDFNDLLSAQKQGEMQLDGTLDKNRFAVVFTKIDDMQAKKYRFHNEPDECLFDKLTDDRQKSKDKAQELCQGIKNLDKEIAKARKRLEKKSGTDGAKIRKAIKVATEKRDRAIADRGLSLALAELSQQQQLHLAIAARNEHVRSSVRQEFAKRQRFLRGRGKTPGPRRDRASSPSDTSSQQLGEVFMTSSRAYWGAENGDPLPGIPTKRFTGIPELKRWIRQNAASHREYHVDDVLSDMRVFLALVNSWSRSAVKVSAALDQRADVHDMEEALERVHSTQLKHVKSLIEDTSECVNRVDPLGERTKLGTTFKRREASVVERWTRIYPDDVSSVDTMRFSTYRAIIKRGGYWKHPKNGVTYNWTGKLGQPIIEALKPSWQRAWGSNLNDLTNQASNRADFIWKPYSREILKVITQCDPSFESKAAILESLVQPSGVSLEKEVASIIRDLKEKGSRMHHETVAPTLREGMASIFEQAAEMKGKGTFEKQKQFLRAAVDRGADELFNQVWDALTAQLKDHILVAQKGLQKLSEKGVEEVKMTLRFWFNGGHAPQMGDTTSKVRRVARDWAESWSLAQPSTEDHEFKQNLSIPDRLSIEDLGRNHAAVSFEDANYYEAIRKGREPSMSDADINNAVKDLKSA